MSTPPRIRPTVVGVAASAAALLGGCGVADDRAAARATVQRFYDAVRAEDGETACTALTEAAREQLESQTSQPCAAVITRLEYGGGSVERVEVAIASAVVRLAGGEHAFLSQTHHGWRISALACRATEGPPREIPLECEVQA